MSDSFVIQNVWLYDAPSVITHVEVEWSGKNLDKCNTYLIVNLKNQLTLECYVSK